MYPGDEGYPAPFGALQVASRKAAVHAAMLKKMLGIMLAANLVGTGIRPPLEIPDRQRLVFALAHKGDQTGAPFARHLQLLRIDLLDDAVEPPPGIPHLFPVNSAVGVLSVGIFGKHHYGEKPLAPHYRTDTGPPCLLGSPDPLAAIPGRFGNVEVVAVDTAECRIDRPDPGRHEGNVPLLVTGGSEPLGNMPLKVKCLLIMGSLFDADFIGKTVYHQDDVTVTFAGHLEGIKTGVFEKRAEIAAKI